MPRSRVIKDENEYRANEIFGYLEKLEYGFALVKGELHFKLYDDILPLLEKKMSTVKNSDVKELFEDFKNHFERYRGAKEGTVVDIPKEFQTPISKTIFYLKNRDFNSALKQSERFSTGDFEDIIVPQVEALLKESGNELSARLFDVIKWQILENNNQ
ncbi:hypothetical protein [Bacteroides congonensis]|uniref:hypothetical protein n=1 Tax=Bacteroides congonensis TaxID=1871006 RepID=UPI0009327C02|nr:hypothetical protein [Bacteroides congonensis]